MRKKFIVLLAVILCITACSSKPVTSPENLSSSETIQENSSSSEVIQEKVPPEETPTEPAPTEIINISDVQTDPAIEDYFGGDLADAIKKMEPLLIPALSLYNLPDLTVFTGGIEDNADIQWELVIAQISGYGEKNSEITNDGTNNYIVTEAVIGTYFNESFANHTTGAPEIVRTYQDMYSGMTGNYTIPAKMDLPAVSASLKNISLSKANSAGDASMSATLDFSLKSLVSENPDVPYGDISIEIISNPQSSYGYSLQSLYFTPSE